MIVYGTSGRPTMAGVKATPQNALPAARALGATTMTIAAALPPAPRRRSSRWQPRDSTNGGV